MSAIPVPDRLKYLPVDDKWKLPVPFFVQWLDGNPEFRIADGDAWLKCVQDEVCWICGQKLGVYRAFVIGPMCSINRISADPPGHKECMEYSVQVCPFMLNPKMVRRDKDRPPERHIAGFSIDRNPGVMLMWVTKKGEYNMIQAPNGYLFNLRAEPVSIAWYRQGRKATRPEIDESIKAGFPTLFEAARIDGDAGIQSLLESRQRAEKYLPI